MVLTKLKRIPDALSAYRNARQFYQEVHLDEKVQDCDSAIQELETPLTSPPSLTLRQKIQHLLQKIKTFIHNLIFPNKN